MTDQQDRTDKSLGIEISRTSVNAVVVDSSGAVLTSSRDPIGPGGNSAAGLDEIADALRGDHPEIASIGIAVPGLVDRKTRRVAFSANIPASADTNIADDLEAAIGLKVHIENDANAAAYGEYVVGAGKGCRNMFYATLGDGVGGAFIFDGSIWHGASGFAGEFGYVPINSEGTRLEDVASSANIIRRTRARFHQDSTSSLSKLAEEEIGLHEIIRAAENEDDFAQLMLERTGTYVGTGIASVINLLNLERIVVGGEIMQAKHLVLNAIVERARELSFEPSFASAAIVEGNLGQDAAAIGAALVTWITA